MVMALDKLIRVTEAEPYPYYRARMTIRGVEYIVSPNSPRVLMVAEPSPKPFVRDYCPYRCQDCNGIFISYDREGLYHRCNGVLD